MSAGAEAGAAAPSRAAELEAQVAELTGEELPPAVKAAAAERPSDRPSLEELKAGLQAAAGEARNAA